MNCPAFRIFRTLLLIVTCSFLSAQAAASGDTTVVRTFRFDSNDRSGVYQFPNDSTKTYEKIIMLYSMRCKNGLISTSTQRDLGCGEWDYNCYTYLVDSAQTDSMLRKSPSYVISNWTDTVFPFTATPQWNYIRSEQQEVNYTSTLSEISAAPFGSSLSPLNNPAGNGSPLGRIQYLWTAAELTAAGFTAGDITGIGLDLSSAGPALENLRIRIGHTTQNNLSSNTPVLSGLSQVYYLSTALPSTGLQRFNFHTPFNWDGISNVVIEYSYSNGVNVPSALVNGEPTTGIMGIASTAPDNFVEANGGQAVIDVPAGIGSAISNKITIAFWCFGNPSALPANTSIFEAFDAQGRRQLNLHLPWSNGSIYWDCGNDGTGYDRINKAAVTTEIEGQWNFWTVTKDVTTGSMKIYLNGNLWHSGTGFTRPITIDRMKIARSMSGGYVYYGGIDEFSMWNTELSPAEITGIMYNAVDQSHPSYANLQLYYRMDETAGNVITDSSPNGLNGTLFNLSRQVRRGKDLFRNFGELVERPATTFYNGTYTTSVTTSTVYDSTAITPNSVISYFVDGANNLQVVDTSLFWAAGVYSYIFDENGVQVDSTLIQPDSTLQVTTLTHYEKRPAKVELINFITPYGIGLNLDGLNGKTWAIDVTDYAPILKGPKYMAMEGGRYQEDNDITFVFYEGTPTREVKSLQSIWPNGSWLEVNYSQIVNNTYFEPRTLTMDPNAQMFKIRSAISGHGQEGEFIPRNHTLRINNTVNLTRSVWTECAENPIYPQGGTWVYDRAGWCPGAAVDVKEYDLTNYVTPGQNVTLDYTLPAASNTGDSRYRVNHQLVTYGAPNFTLDAAVDYIKAPTNRVEYGRENPSCNKPIVSIRNTGSTQLTSLTFTYGRLNGTMSTYQWSGILDFLGTEEVELPQPDYLSSNSDKFIVIVSDPNGGTDQYGLNDTLINTFNYTSIYASDLIVEVKTNNYGSHTSYTLTDSQGNPVLTRSGLAANTVYRDTLNLPTDCYTFYLTDAGDDGLSWWANTNQGTGYCRLRKASNGAILRTFNADFGDNIYQQFTVNYALPVVEVQPGEAGPLSVFPNPASDLVQAVFTLNYATKATLLLTNAIGQVLQSHEVYSTNSEQRIALDVSGLENGLYHIVLQSGKEKSVQKLSIIR